MEHAAEDALGTLPQQVVDACRAASLRIGGRDARMLGVTSAQRREGRTTVALAMAYVLCRWHRQAVALVDMDFEEPMLARRQRLEAAPGLAELACGDAPVADVMHELDSGLFVVT